jgi:hypothetical protein
MIRARGYDGRACDDYGERVYPSVMDERPSKLAGLTIAPVRPHDEVRAFSAGRRPVILTGHQAGFWHAGILSKYMAAEVIAGALGGTVAHLVVDHDAGGPTMVTYPTRDLRRRSVRISAEEVPQSRPGCFSPPLSVDGLRAALANDALTPDVQRGLASIAEAIGAWSTEKSAAAKAEGASGGDSGARQAWEASKRLMLPWVARAERELYSSAFGALPAFAGMVEEMAHDARACIESYNRATARYPRARVAALQVMGGRYQLPLWRLNAQRGTREAVYHDEVAQIPMRELAPRALLLSTFARMHLCDLFIHGTGGGLYDLVTQAWLSEWRPGWRLAPGMVVSATCFVTVDTQERLIDPVEIARRVHAARRARHDPDLASNVAEGARMSGVKAAFVERIRASASAAERRSAFREMHDWIQAQREVKRAEIEGLRVEATKARESTRRASVAFDRTYPFVMVEGDTLRALRRGIEEKLG